jgi:hypothetical protein
VRLLPPQFAVATLVCAGPVWAGRPFITDDAGVVGERTFQLETWLREDRDSALHHAVVAYGVVPPLELSVAGAHGTLLDGPPLQYGLAGPTLQAKLLLFEPRPEGWFGVALATGGTTATGTGDLEPSSGTAYGYSAFTWLPDAEERFDLHVNVGSVVLDVEEDPTVAVTWGVDVDVAVVGPLHVFTELVSGLPETSEPDAVLHAGMKCELSDDFHVDGTFGTRAWGEESLPTFGTLGVRWSTEL